MRNVKHDVAVLQLERPAQLSDKVTTICLPDQDADLNSKCYITGLTAFTVFGNRFLIYLLNENKNYFDLLNQNKQVHFMLWLNFWWILWTFQESLLCYSCVYGQKRLLSPTAH